MANIRFLYDNAAGRATISASSTAGTLVATNMQGDIKSAVWRGVSTTESITLTWPTSEFLNMVALPFCNLTSAATMRVRCYTLAGDANPAYDATTTAAPGVSFGSVEWGTSTLGVNAYSYGGGTYAAAYFPVGTYQKVIVTLADPTNAAGYIECSRIVTGQYWSPLYSAEAGAAVSITDTSKNERTDAGDLVTDRGTVAKMLNFDLNFLTSTDRDKVYRMLRGNGMFRPIFISLVPESTDAGDEQVFQIYGKLSKGGSMKYQLLNQYSTTIEIEEV